MFHFGGTLNPWINKRGNNWRKLDHWDTYDILLLQYYLQAVSYWCSTYSLWVQWDAGSWKNSWGIPYSFQNCLQAHHRYDP